MKKNLYIISLKYIGLLYVSIIISKVFSVTGIDVNDKIETIIIEGKNHMHFHKI